MSAKSPIELHSSSIEKERSEQDPTGNLGERFRLLVRQVLGRRRYFSPRECVKILAKPKTVPPEAMKTEPHEISDSNTSL